MTDDIEQRIENHPLLIAAKRTSQTSDLITIAEAAAILEVSLRTTRRRQKARLMPARRKIIRTWKYERADVEKLRDSLEKRGRGPRP